MSNLLDTYVQNKPITENKPVNTVTQASTVHLQKPVNNVVPNQSINKELPNDSFEKQDKKEKIKKAAKYTAIGAGIAAVAYSAFALVKYGKGSQSLGEALAEPIKVLKARMNPNGFMPKTDIMQDELDYMAEVGLYLRRLTPKQKNEYVQNLYQKSNFNVEAKEKFERIFSQFLD